MSGKYNTVAFKEGRFDDVLQGEQAWNIIYRKASICACRNDSTGGPSKKCPICKGYGFVWEPVAVEGDSGTVIVEGCVGSQTKPLKVPLFVREGDIAPVTYQGVVSAASVDEDGLVSFTPEIESGAMVQLTYNTPLGLSKALVTRAMANKEWRNFGELHYADLSFTPPKVINQNKPNPAWYIAEYDQIIALDLSIKKQEILFKGRRDEIIYPYLKKVHRVHSVGREDYAVTDYVQGVDFNISNGQIDWIGNSPPEHNPYGIEYTSAPMYYVWTSLPQGRFEGGKRLPPNVLLKSWEFFLD